MLGNTNVCYLCPNCRKFVETGRGGNLVGASCPKCGMSLGVEDRAFPRTVRVKCPAPLCGYVFRAAFSIHGGSAGATCPKCETDVGIGDAFPSLPVRVARGGFRAAVRAAAWSVLTSWAAVVAVGKGIKLAACSPFVAVRAAGRAALWLVLAPFRAVATTARFLFNLPFVALERYLRLNKVYSIQNEHSTALAELASAIRKQAEPVPAPVKMYVPSAPPAARPSQYDGLLPNCITKIMTPRGEMVCDVMKHDILFDEMTFIYGTRECDFFMTRCGKTNAEANFYSDFSLVPRDRIFLLKRMWAEIKPQSKVPEDRAMRFMANTEVRFDNDESVCVQGNLIDLVNREAQVNGVVICGEHRIDIKLRPSFRNELSLRDDDKVIVRVVFDGVVLRPRARVSNCNY